MFTWKIGFENIDSDELFINISEKGSQFMYFFKRHLMFCWFYLFKFKSDPDVVKPIQNRFTYKSIQHQYKEFVSCIVGSVIKINKHRNTLTVLHIQCLRCVWLQQHRAKMRNISNRRICTSSTHLYINIYPDVLHSIQNKFTC